MSRFSIVFTSTVVLTVVGCASMPNGPGVMVLPGTGMSFERFSNDNAVCQQFASFQVGGATANQAAVNSGVASAAVGTVVGAAAGAALGAASGNPAAGAAIGAGVGLMGGSLAGTSAAGSSMYETQQRYDAAYIQCMYAKGHQVPVSGQFSGAISQPAVTPPSHIPPPPPGATPPGSSLPANIPPPPPGSPPAPPPQ